MRKKILSALRELKIELPIAKYDCYECPGAWYFRRPRVRRQHSWECLGQRYGDKSYVHECRTCGKVNTLEELSHMLISCWPMLIIPRIKESKIGA